MSLNGLDGVAVAEAHQAALAEPGGWYVQFNSIAQFVGSMLMMCYS